MAHSITIVKGESPQGRDLSPSDSSVDTSSEFSLVRNHLVLLRPESLLTGPCFLFDSTTNDHTTRYTSSRSDESVSDPLRINHCRCLTRFVVFPTSSMILKSPFIDAVFISLHQYNMLNRIDPHYKCIYTITFVL